MKKCLDALFATDSEADRASITSKKGQIVPGTCDWVTQQPSHIEWSQSASNQLCIVGDLGKGKTMLAVYISKSLEQLGREHNFAIIYCFCDHSDEKRNTASAILRALLFQTLEARPALVKYAKYCVGGDKRAEERAERTLASRDALWFTFNEIMKDPELRNITCVIDGLDECDQNSASWLARKIAGCRNEGLTCFLIVTRSIIGVEQLLRIDQMC